jgi:hypothetical protein
LDGLDVLATTIEATCAYLNMPGQASLADAVHCAIPSDSAGLWFTDPPYYDAVPYADLSDFFFVWLKRALPQHPLHRDPFTADNPLTPKAAEAVQDETKSVEGDPLVNINDPVLPGVQMNAKRLRKPARYVIDQRKPFGLSAVPIFFLLGLVGFLFVFPVCVSLADTVVGCRADRP